MRPPEDRTLGEEEQKVSASRDKRIEQGPGAESPQAPSIARAPGNPESPPLISESKKRALDALERRFAAASKSADNAAAKRYRPSVSKGKSKVEDCSVASPQQPCDSALKPRAQSGISDVQPHPGYSEISQILHDNLKTNVSKESNRGDDVNRVIRDILLSGDKGYQYAKGSRNVKFDSWILLDNFVSKNAASANSRTKALKNHSNRSKKHMSMREHRRCGSFNLPKEFHNFDQFKPMHEIWKDYILELLKEIGGKKLAQNLLIADLHGAILSECKTSAFKGVNGIMIRETAQTFGIITTDNRFRVVPKKGSVFILQAGPWKITLYGDKLSLRCGGA
ncbi:Ribonuclease P protein [Dioscorea alata]|uniref:Ribonuclease P protein n=1 Tax=Dioscorea alata TaxID=55571 RepID=A0ACB7U8T7_DIOAL|nr:Ribonuclease P protein [Dioscorea alata]